MSTQEAQLLPVADTELRQKQSAACAQSGTARMGGESNPAVLMLEGVTVSRQELREAAGRAHPGSSLELVHDRRELLDELRRGAAVIVAGPEPLPGVSLGEVLERARRAEPPVPVVLVGGNDSESESLRVLSEGAADYLPAAGLDRLPSVLSRALKLHDSVAAQSRAQTEFDRAATVLRENQKLITLGRLAATIAHEINNPLEAVTNLLYLLGQEQELPESARGYLALAQRELGRVAQISRQTLNFSRETTGPVGTRIDTVFEEVLSLYSRRIAEKDLRVDRQYDCLEQAVVYPGEMRQVFSNLIVNAVDASSSHGQLRIRIRSAHSWTDPGVRGIRATVGDNGSGIDPEIQRRLGEPFFTTKGQRGTGLGLWVTRSIILRYGGEIHLRSSVAPDRHGTVFSVFLPTNMRPQMVERPSAPGEGASTSPKVQTFDRSSSPIDHASSTGPRRRVQGE
jgi:two-component system, NtrC family, sensor kinase